VSQFDARKAERVEPLSIAVRARDGVQPTAVSRFRSHLVRKAREIRPSDDLLLFYGSHMGRELQQFTTEAEGDLPPVVVLADQLDFDDLFLSVSHGAAGYLLESEDIQGLAKALELAARGDTVLTVLAPPTVAKEIIGIMQAWARGSVLANTNVCLDVDGLPDQGSPRPRLSPRQRQIMTLLASGMTAHHIAREMSLSEKTVRNYLTRIYSKLGVHSQYEALLRWLGVLSREVVDGDRAHG
jgi:DNA-binding NarL/FixJ family response regulator